MKLPSACSVARALDVLGDWWTLLIIREAFYPWCSRPCASGRPVELWRGQGADGGHRPPL
ncbi:hypothetical protein G6O69_05050 [Pseudenhygromyxa sp. WMMC2535]|uniref:winged helix-turn-helix transcriptional regulator n=1 Tax=Pseudenhygromyxa sp. WMMC2535 TaxID=2712867 RepID=UPI001595162C|nr:hypothetical protein [Pseudenhygromyxa sp. WMMC2535]NVB37188.1 hypothetical protein [Pseudenhygromyxa sp. WMMC2535]